MGRVATMLSHFYVSPMSEAEARAVANDWADALGEFPQWAVDEACRDWLRNHTRKPTIADIRGLCVHHFAVVDFTRQKAMRGPVESRVREVQSPERRAEIAERLAKMGQEAADRMRAKMEGGAA